MALRKHKSYTPEDLSAALIMTSLTSGFKRHLPAEADDEHFAPLAKRRATEAKVLKTRDSIETQAIVSATNWVLKPAPYFYYNDRSREPDDDPLTPLTPPGLVPTFPAKMHAILSNKELSDVIEWLPHGRAWRILKPRTFEIHVLPRYFHHNKLSSFVRQTNGWGFRRLTQGYDRNAYYHEYFLKGKSMCHYLILVSPRLSPSNTSSATCTALAGLPHLSKKMVRPKVAEKKSVEPDHEPDLYAISREFPLPTADDESKHISFETDVMSSLSLMCT
ncbi:hypothetical protein HJC23_013097 [Cyclotella cryptica]|uniref:HSF-type DNA-binding domain-containing protein n=1 Tax=Cyclotella cryptica TaxID=29204 RepID=A0ABD3PIJ3_9STRA|eukprot:CCRYP_014761-RA/>CCRYP_014761-RA protein AED:0.35 eAED:0.35 QI:237/1/0.66/1/1/1/3/0/275